MRTRGFTFIEILIVMIIIGVIAAFGIPRFHGAIEKNNVRAARAAVGTTVAKARAAAIQRGCRAYLHFTSGSDATMWVAVCNLRTPALDTLGGIDSVSARWNVTVTASRDSVIYLPSGISRDYLPTLVVFTSNAVRDSIIINEVGKVVR